MPHTGTSNAKGSAREAQPTHRPAALRAACYVAPLLHALRQLCTTLHCGGGPTTRVPPTASAAEMPAPRRKRSHAASVVRRCLRRRRSVPWGVSQLPCCEGNRDAFNAVSGRLSEATGSGSGEGLIGYCTTRSAPSESPLLPAWCGRNGHRCSSSRRVARDATPRHAVATRAPRGCATRVRRRVRSERLVCRGHVEGNGVHLVHCDVPARPG
jgi:hypothetical protein